MINLQTIQTAHTAQCQKKKKEKKKTLNQKVGRRPKQKSLQRRHTDGKEAHKKMPNITNYHRSVNQNYNGVSSHIGHNGHHQWPSSKKLQLINAKGGVEKREPSYTVGGNIN